MSAAPEVQAPAAGTAPAAAPAAPAVLQAPALLAYGLFGLPLGMVALPVYLHIPQLYALHFGLSLTAIGGVLLLTRMLDAFADPLIGAWIDRSRAPGAHARAIALALPLLILGFTGLFVAPALGAAVAPVSVSPAAVLAWLAGTLVIVHAGYSVAGIAYQSWGAALSQRPGERTRITGMREAWGLAGVLLAAAMPAWLGFPALLSLFAGALAIAAFLLLACAPRARHTSPAHAQASSLKLVLGNRAFRWLLAVFALNGIAAAVPATLFLFFASDRLQLQSQSGLLLALYFIGGIASVPAWAALARRTGEARAWLGAMLLAVVVFVWTWWLPAGAFAPFALICVAAGCALGADLALPPALLAGVIGRAGHAGRHEGAYFGIWNWATKLNLALAAGLALPLLDWLGYTPGTANAEGLHALGLAYAVLPCALKLAAAALLARAPLHHI